MPIKMSMIAKSVSNRLDMDRLYTKERGKAIYLGKKWLHLAIRWGGDDSLKAVDAGCEKERCLSKDKIFRA